MNYVFHPEADPAQVNDFVQKSDMATLEQCPDFALVKDNWQHQIVSVTQDDKMVASAVILEHPSPLGPLFYIPRGPVLDYHNLDLLKYTLEQIRQLAKKRHAFAIRFDPAVCSREYLFTDREQDHPRQHEDAVKLLKDMGIRHNGYNIEMFDATRPRFIAGTYPDPDYRSKLEYNTRQRLRKASEKGVEIAEGPEYLDAFCTCMKYTEQRKNVVLRDKEYFQRLLDVYKDHCLIMVTYIDFPKQIKKLQDEIEEGNKALADPNLGKRKKADWERKIKQDQSYAEELEKGWKREGTDRVYTCGTLAVYNQAVLDIMYMGNHPDYLNTHSSFLLYAACIDRTIDLKIRYCSFGGVEGNLSDGLTAFKKHWLMNVEEYIGEFNWVLNAPVYWGFTEVYPKIREWQLKHEASREKKKAGHTSDDQPGNGV